MRENILAELEAVERERGVRVLLAVESGSRAWGMASEDSDYDVRFVYARDARDYLRLEKVRDTIEWRLDDVLDVTGWDLAKFLRFVRNSNPTVFEWLSSPITYRVTFEFFGVREVSAACFSPKASAFHYLGMERGHDRAYLSGEKVGAKKYLYVVRALLAARWCLEERTPAPMLLADLIDAKLPEDLRPLVSMLLEVKAIGKERALVRHVPELDDWVVAEDADLCAMAQAEPKLQKVPWDVLDVAFLDVIGRWDAVAHESALGVADSSRVK